jgi:hypothetical protein
MATQYFCSNENRRDAVRTLKGSGGKPVLNGMDYLEVVTDDEKTLEVHFIHPLPGETSAVPPSPAPVLTEANFVIRGGVRVLNIAIVKGSLTFNGRIARFDVEEAGDYSTYTLMLVAGEENEQPPSGFDPQLAEIDFSFKVECPSDFDCAPEDECLPENLPAPLIDYLAKDYSSFRRLMLDRLSTVMPNWQERNPADMGVAVVETIAYAADQLSYYQDAVGTEAYLGTARQRISTRRHARLLDYAMHDGCNARAWICIEVEEGGGADGLVLDPLTPVLTRGMVDAIMVSPNPTKLAALIQEEKPGIFETLHPVTLNSAHNSIKFYTWDNTECCLPKGATRATLLNDPQISLQVGDVLIFEEVISPETGFEADADPAHRQAVRLTRVVTEDEGGDPLLDPLHDTPVAEIEWSREDSLTFPLCISAKIGDGTGANLLLNLSVARGNVVLADFGRSISEPITLGVDENGNLMRPMLKKAPVAQQGHARDQFGQLVRDAQNEPVVFDPQGSAAYAMHWEMRDTLPAAQLIEDGDTTRPWLPRRDLLASNRFDRHFTVEIDNDGDAFLRFGDGFHAIKPQTDHTYSVDYRVGNGVTGNVGAESLTRIVLAGSGVTRVRNPLPAIGGMDSESIKQVQLYAPQAFRTQERAITEADYAAAAERHPEVQKAAATLRWTGSWYTVFITVDRMGGLPVDADFEKKLRIFIERFRMAGQDLEIDAPLFVPLDIIFTVCINPGYYRAHVKEELLKLFSSRDLVDGRRGFFHPDHFTFGQTLYLSQMIAMVMSVPGVKWVDAQDIPTKPNRFRRWGQPSDGEFDAGRITFGRLEIARLDNDPSAPENGRIDFIMEGGL